MSGFLGTLASAWSDLSLILTIVLGLVAAFGGIQAHRRRFSTHCPVMAAAALFNWVPVLLVMVPAWVSAVAGTESPATGPLAMAPVFHGVLGGVTQLLMTYTVTRMYWIERLPPDRPIWLMRTTMGLWLLTLIGGIVVYVTSYVG
jgi:uncharacterized membrane protein YozB (DUF420 family)